MAKGQDDPADRDDGRVLAPDELDISEDEHVAEIEDGRYVVSPNDPIDSNDAKAPSAPTQRSPDKSRSKPDKPAEKQPEDPEPQREPVKTDPQPSQSEPTQQRQPLDEQRVHEWLSSEFDGANSRYGFDVTAKFDGPVKQRQMMSNDVVTIFESLILWYAQHIDSNTPVEEVLGILLMESNVPIRYPPESLQRVIRNSGLHPDDSIKDLIEAIEADDGLKF